MRAAAWPGRVVELRFCGVYLPAALILRRPLHSGWIVSRDVGPNEWRADLHASLDDDRTPINGLHEIKSIRQNAGGTYLMQGMAWDAGYLKRWQQDWLCGPDDASVSAALQKMEHWLRQRYTGTFGPRN